MSISPTTLLSLQHAGESLDAAKQAFAQEVQSNAECMVGIVSSEPFGTEADRAYAQLRAIARLAHELQAMEEQLKTMYRAAAEMTVPETPVLVALSDRGRRSRIHQNEPRHEGAEDVIVKPAPQRPAHKAKTKRKAVKAATSSPQHLSTNDEKVLQHLRKVLDRRSWKPLTQASIAQGAGIPAGSVGLAIRRLVAGGAVREGSKGSYRLA